MTVLADKEITLELKHPTIILLLLFLCVIFFFELQLTLTSPIVFGDEGFHTRMAQYIAQQKEYPIWVPFEGTNLFRDGFSRPPLWELTEGSLLYIFGFSELIVKFLTPFIASILIGIAVYVLVRRIYDEKIAFITSVITVTIPSFVTYAVLFYVDILFTFYFSLFALTFILAIETENKKYFLLSGIFGVLSLLTKTPGIAAVLIIGIIFLYQLFREKKNFHHLIKNYSIMIAIALIIFSPFILRSLVYYKNPACFLPIPFVSNNGCNIHNFTESYTFPGRTQQVGTEQSLFQIGIINYLTFAYGNVWFVILALFAGITLMINKPKKSDLVILTTILVMMFVISQATVRAEDTSRYTLGWVPMIALVSARYFNDAYDFLKKNWTMFGALLLLLIDIMMLWFYSSFSVEIKAIFGFAIAIPVFYFIATRNYNFALVVALFSLILLFSLSSALDKITNMKSVKMFAPSFFEACNWIKQNLPEDSLTMTVWSHRAIYSCQRDFVGNMADISVSNDLNHTLSFTKEQGITHIFIQKFSIGNEALSEQYSVNFVQLLEKNPNHFKKIYDSGPDIATCISQGGCDGATVYEIIY